MKLVVVCLMVALVLVLAFGRLAAGAPQAAPAAAPAAPTATYDPFGTNGCKTCDPQQRRIQATSISQ